MYKFMHDMLNMYVVPDDYVSAFLSAAGAATSSLSDLEQAKAYKQISPDDGYGPDAKVYADKYIDYKKMYNIDVRFDVESEVDKIELGQASIDDFSGDELSLIMLEVDYRKSIDARAAPHSALSGCSVVSMMSRNTYYRKKKVIEYAKFIDNMVGSSSVSS